MSKKPLKINAGGAFRVLLSGWLIFAAAVLPAPGAVRADSLVTLPELLDEARRNNLDLAAARKRWEAVQAKIPMAKGLPAPKIGVEFEDIPRGTVKLNKAMIMIQLIQALPFPGKLSAKQAVAVKEAQTAGAMFKQTEWEVSTALKTAYYNLFLIDREMEIQQEQVLWMDQASAAVQARYETGAAPQAEFLRAQAETSESKNALTVLRYRRRALEAHLNHLLNRPVGAPLGVPSGPDLEGAVPSSPEELWAQAEQSQPDLLLFKFSAERAEAAWKLSKRELLPDLETMLELRDPPMAPIGPWDLTLALVLPFWFWTKQKYGVKAALYDKESAQAAYQAMRNEVMRRIHEHWNEAQAFYSTAHLSRDRLIPLASQSVSSAMADYQAGHGSFLELLDALKVWSERRKIFYRDLVALEQHRVMLEQAVGVSFREEHKLAQEGKTS